MLGYHFCRDLDGQPVLRDNTPCPGVGEVEIFTGNLCLGTCGLHASPTPYGALLYAPGPWIRHVKLSGNKIIDASRIVCAAERKTLNGPVDITNILRFFAGVTAARALALYTNSKICRAAMPAAKLAIQWGLTGVTPKLAEINAARTNTQHILHTAYLNYNAKSSKNVAGPITGQLKYVTAAAAFDALRNTVVEAAIRASSNAACAAAIAACATYLKMDTTNNTSNILDYSAAAYSSERARQERFLSTLVTCILEPTNSSRSGA